MWLRLPTPDGRGERAQLPLLPLVAGVAVRQHRHLAVRPHYAALQSDQVNKLWLALAAGTNAWCCCGPV